MSFVKNYTPPDFRAKDFVPLISLNFHSYSDKNTHEFVFLEKFTPLHNVQFVKYDVTVSFMAQVLDTVTYLVPQVLDTAS